MPKKTLSLPSSSFTRNLPWILTAIGLLFTLLAFSYVRNVQKDSLLELFDTETSKIREAIQNRMDDYTLSLLSTRGLFESSSSVERDEFASFVNSLHITEFLPGIQGIGYSEFLGPKSNVATLEERIRAEGFPDFRVTPVTDRNEYHSIIYLEPFDDRNRRAFGFEMHSESTRSEAMDRARDSGIPALSGRVTLLQEKNEDVQAGTLLYVPLFDKSLPITNALERRKALKGFVYAPFRMGNLFRTVIPPRELSGIDVEIFDGSEAEEHLLFTNEPSDEDYTPLFSKEEEIIINGRTWIIDFHSAKYFDALLPLTTLIVVAVSGVLISVLLGFIAFSLVRTTERSEKRALQITAEMRATEESWKLALEANGDGVWDWNMQTNEVKRTKRYAEMLGYTEQEIADTEHAWEKLVHPDDMEATKIELDKHFAGKIPLYVRENRMRTKDGSYKWILDRGKVVSWTKDGKPLRMIGTFTDIQERKKIEAELTEKNGALERANTLMIGRELRMKELKEELDRLQGNSKNPPAA